ncbi:transposase [Streptomyces sp. NPDC085932]|uniref:transposase n=1 Tax=Streptomyces sp. NPDC085932 TaxID=3365741 RepID=UPI0037CCF65E
MTSRCCPSRPQNGSGLAACRVRQALCGILFVLHTGIQWEYSPRQLGFGSEMTCWQALTA